MDPLTNVYDLSIGNETINFSAITSNVTDPSHTVSNWTRFVVHVLISMPLSVLGILGNILAFLVLIQIIPRMTTNAWLMNILVVDTCVLVFTILLRSLRYLPYYTRFFHGYGDADGPYPSIFVYCYPWLYWARLLTTWLCVMLTWDRFVVVCRPMRVTNVYTFSRFYRQLLAVALLSFIFTIPRFFEYNLDTDNEYGYSAADIMKNYTYTIVYRICLFFVFMYLIPVVLLIVMNYKLVASLRQADTIRKNSITILGPNRRMKYANRPVTILVIVVVSLFITRSTIAMTAQFLYSLEICFPHLTVIETPRRYTSIISDIVITLNSALNILIYSFSSKNFRQTFKKVLKCRR